MVGERVTLDQYLAFEGRRSRIDRIRYPSIPEHIERYKFAAQLLDKSTGVTLDAGCGCGWGTSYLAQHTNSKLVIGVDIDQEEIKKATIRFPLPNITFHQADIIDRDYFYRPDYVENIVCFETLEHVRQEEAPALLGNFRSVQTDQGNLIISTPNRPLFSPYSDREGSPWYRFHFYEYTQQGFLSLLERCGFRVEGLYGQRFVDQRTFQILANLLYPLRGLALRSGFARDSLPSQLPILIRGVMAAAFSEAGMRKVNEGDSPLFLTAVCSKR